MKDDSLLKLGGVAAILIGALNVAGSFLYFFLPEGQRAAQPAAAILPSIVKEGSSVLYLIFWTQALVGLLGLIATPGLSRLVERVNEGWVRWMTNLAALGFAISAAGYLLDIEKLQKIANAYDVAQKANDAVAVTLITATWKSSLDEQGIWGYGAVGAWILVVSWLALRNATFPRPLAYVGLALGIVQLLIPPGVMLKNQPWLLILVAVGGVLAPIWYVWGGLVARRAKEF